MTGQPDHLFRSSHRFARITMSLSQADNAINDTEALRQENADLKNQLVRLSRASISISENLDVEAALQKLVNSA